MTLPYTVQSINIIIHLNYDFAPSEYDFYIREKTIGTVDIKKIDKRVL